MMRMLHGTAVHLCADATDYVAAATDWSPGAAFPLLPGPAFDRYRALFADTALPAVDTAPRAGFVVSTGGDVGAAAGKLLAEATGRPYRHVPADRLIEELAAFAGELVAVVGLADDVALAGDWSGRSGAKVGLVVARSEQALACLVYRTLTVGAAGEDTMFVSSHPLLEGAMDADACDFAGLDHVRTHRPKLLVLRGQGRECCNSVLDGMICGRSDPIDSPSLPLDPTQRATPCLTGQGCFRTDLTEAELLPAQDVHATLVFMHACTSIMVGTNAYPLRISVSLGMLDGTAVAVIGVLGVHVLQRSAQFDLEDALAERLPLGEVVERMQERSRPLRGALNRFGLLGDPALVLDPPCGLTTQDRPKRDEESVRRLREMDQVIIPRLERMRWLYVDVPETELLAVRRRIRQLFANSGDPRLAEWTREVDNELAAVQQRMVELLVERIFSPGWDPGWVAWCFEQVSEQDADCPNCRRPIATRLVMRHRMEPELQLQTLQCRRCGDVWWTTDPGEPTFAITGPIEIEVAGRSLAHIERDVVNRSGDVLRGGVGYTFRARKNLGLPSGRSEPCEVGPYASHHFRAPLDLVDCDVPADTHTTPVIAVLNGIYLSSMVMMHLA